MKLARGSMLGRYMLLERVGAGGMGVVYAAYDPELDRRVALKVLKSDAYGDPMASRGGGRLLREAQAMAKLWHPNVVAVHDVGTLGREVFIAMEFIQGSSLRAWLARGDFNPAQIVEVFIQAGRGVVAAHAAGLIHRDFKPDNVLVAENGRIVVTDFGLARRKSSEDATTQSSLPSSSATAKVIRSLEDAVKTGANAGTPAYMAPEQHLRGEITEAADQFAFCVALYEALHGQHPFRGTDPVSLSTSVVDDMRRPLSADAQRVPRRIRRAIERGLRNDPDSRWPSMRALLAQLGPGPVAARRKWLAVGVTGASAAAALGLWASDSPALACRGADRHFEGIWDTSARTAVRDAFAAASMDRGAAAFRKVEARLDAYAEDWVDMRTEACEATAHGEQSEELLDRRSYCLDVRRVAFEQLVQVFSRADAEVVTRSSQATLDLPSIEACADVGALQASYAIPTPQQLPDVDEARSLRAKAEALQSAGKFRDGVRVAEVALRKAEASTYVPEIAWSRLTLSTAQAHLGNNEAAETLALEVLVEAREIQDADLEAATWLHLLEVMAVDPRRHDEARRWLDVAGAAVTRADDAGAHSAALARLEGSLAEAAEDFATAASHFERALELEQGAHGKDSPQVALATSRLAVALARGRMTRRAREICLVATERLTRAFGRHHPRMLQPAGACADLEHEQMNIVRARELYARAYVIAVEAYGPRHVEVARALLGLGSLHVSKGEFDDAVGLQRDALSIAAEAAGDDATLTARARISLATSLRELGQSDEAASHAKRATATFREALGQRDPRVARATGELALSELAQGDEESAQAHLREALDGRLSQGSREEAVYATALAEILLERRRSSDAVELLARVAANSDGAAVSSTMRATVLFLYARAVDRAGGSPEHATKLATQARTELLRVGSTGSDALANVERWLADRGDAGSSL